jgi:2-aminomuconate deaminase
MSDSIQSGRAPKPLGAYPHARRAGSFLFLSGIGPRPAGGGPVKGIVFNAAGDVEAYDIEAQVHAVFANVRAVLEDAGADWSDLVDVTVFLTDIARDFDTYNRLYATYFDGNGPTRTTVEVSRLPGPIAIELKCIAALQD